MVRYFFVCCLVLCMYEGVLGQGVVVKKSQEVVVIKGNSYYFHTVLPGQTLYSICKAYEADVEEVKKLNNKKDNALSLNEVLKIPYAAPFVQYDNKYYYHKVEKGETLYSISRRYGVKVKWIQRANDSYNGKKPLPVGAVVRLPLNEVDPIVLKSLASKTVTPDKTIPQVARENGIKEERKTDKEGIQAQKPPVNQIPAERSGAITETISVDRVVAGSDIKVALLLPFYAKEYSTMRDTLNVGKISSKSEPFLYFYEGILLAVDSLKNKGYNITLHVYDTERDVKKAYNIAEELNTLGPDLIIGPVYASVFKTVADNLENKNIPLVYPLSARSEQLGNYPNFIQVNTSASVLSDKMATWIGKQSAHANVIQIDLPKTDHDTSSIAEKKQIAEKISRLPGVKSFKWNASSESMATFKKFLLPDRENILVLQTKEEVYLSEILPVLSVYADNFKITVIGCPEWQTFNSVDHEMYYKLNVKFFSYSYVDNSSTQARLFTEKYWKYFYADPNNITYKAFDIGLYFIELASKYRGRALDAIEYHFNDYGFSKFNFSKIPYAAGYENRGLLIVNYSSDYQIIVQPM